MADKWCPPVSMLPPCEAAGSACHRLLRRQAGKEKAGMRAGLGGSVVSPEGNQVGENESECSFLFLLGFLSQCY